MSGAASSIINMYKKKHLWYRIYVEILATWKIPCKIMEMKSNAIKCVSLLYCTSDKGLHIVYILLYFAWNHVTEQYYLIISWP